MVMLKKLFRDKLIISTSLSIVVMKENEMCV